MEIERKFKVAKLPENLQSYRKDVIEQGYLCVPLPTVRIRKTNEYYSLTYKNKEKDLKEGKAIQNIENNMFLTKENYEILKEKVDYHMIIKDRYYIPIDDKLCAELDIFKGNLEGLIYAEVEFSDIEASENFQKPDWLGEDVSFNTIYDNTVLCKLDKYDPKDF